MINKDELNELEYCLKNDPNALDKIKPSQVLELISFIREVSEQGVKAGLEFIDLHNENAKLKREKQNLIDLIPRFGDTCRHGKDGWCVHPEQEESLGCYRNDCPNGKWEVYTEALRRNQDGTN